MEADETLRVLREQESIRQMAAAFDHDLRVKNRLSILQSSMGYAAIFVFGGIACIAGAVILRYDHYPSNLVSTMAAALVADVLALAATVWKVIMGRDPLRTPDTPPPVSTAKDSSDR
jgi:hypothetical protein